MSAPAPHDEAALEQLLAVPTPAAIDALVQCPGDVLVMGASGKMGPSFVRLLLAAAQAASARGSAPRTVHAVARFAHDADMQALADAGAAVHRADALDPRSLARLPDVASVFHLVGHKFGTATDPVPTWAHNVVAATHVTDRFRGARCVLYSTGNVYPLSPVAQGGSREDDALAPGSEYAAAVVGRERVFMHAARRDASPVALLRIFYAHDLRYGVLTDLACKVRDGTPIDLAMGHVTVIWQGDANALAVAALPRASTPDPYIVNITGTAIESVRAVAEQLGARLGRAPAFTGREAPDALLGNTDRMQRDLGTCTIDTATLIDWVAAWVAQGGRLLGKPTHFAVRDGRY
ncbi:MAG: NAD-dependent epimerase/dehydratase family protein [Gemmatimonadaceae bacterium]|jgi:nucleoside-diphosphate-sugar epimerase|nr:NAD-dependent epimerase/dehydratase family protein [Gemmatimonadaceae bacterium]